MYPGGQVEQMGDPTQDIPADEMDFGPVRSGRKSADICCCIFFVIFIATWMCFAFYYIVRNDLATATAPLDYYGFKCGESGNFAYDRWVDKQLEGANETLAAHDAAYFKNRTLLFFYGGTLADSRCVHSCPSYDESTTIWKATDPSVYEDFMYSTDTTPFIVAYRTEPLMGRCVPDLTMFTGTTDNDTEANATDILALLGDAFAGQIIEDFENGWLTIVWTSLLAIVIAFIWIYLMRCCTWLITWLTIWSLFFVLAGSAYFYTKKGYDQKSDTANLNESSGKTTFYIGIALCVIAVLYLLIICWLHSRIKLAVAVIETTARGIGDMKTIMVVPVVFFIIIIAWMILWVYTTLKLFSDEDAMTYTEGRRSWSYSKNTWILFLIHFFVFFWMIFFCMALNEMTIAGALADWYFVRGTEEDRAEIPSPVLSAFGRAFKYNLGSVAFGSFIVALLCWIKWLLRYIERKAHESKNKQLETAAKCLACCVAYVQKIVQYINRNAYIFIAINGGSFLSGAKNAVMLIATNIVRAAAINFIGDFVLFIGKLLVAACCALICGIFLLAGDTVYHYWIVLSFTTFVVSFIIASLILNTMEMGIDTMFMCFLKDTELAKNSDGRMYAPKELQDFYKDLEDKDEKTDE